MNNFEKLKLSLQKTKSKLFNGINEAFTGKAIVDEDIIRNIEELLISSDIGFDTTAKIITAARSNLKNNSGRDESSFKESIFNELKNILIETELSENKTNTLSKPNVVLIVGVNGVGKTTSIGKLAYQSKKEGNKVLICAADTFRAAASDQLDIWAKEQMWI